MTLDDLEPVFQLRNHPEIRRYMFTQHEISKEEHEAWFKKASQNPGIKLMVFETNQKCIGFVQLKETNYKGVFDWGFYAAPDAPKGTGRRLGQAALKIAFKEIEVHKICGQAVNGNQPSIKLHTSLGFIQEGILRDHYFDGKEFHHIICFGLLRRNWLMRNSE